MMDVMEGLYQVVQERKGEKREGSYTCYLFEQGLDKILKKCGEECSEVIIAAKNGKNEDTANGGDFGRETAEDRKSEEVSCK